MGHAQGDLDVLLDEQNADAGVVDARQGVGHSLGDGRRQAQEGLVHHQQLGPRHEPPPEGQHLLFAAA